MASGKVHATANLGVIVFTLVFIAPHVETPLALGVVSGSVLGFFFNARYRSQRTHPRREPDL